MKMQGRSCIDEYLAPVPNPIREKRALLSTEKNYEQMYGKGIPAAELVAVKKKEAIAKKYAAKKYEVKRTAFCVIAIVLMVIVLAVMGLGMFSSMRKAFAVYTFTAGEETTSIGFLDPLFSALKGKSAEVAGMPTSFADIAKEENGFVSFALSAAIALYLAFTFVTLIKGIMGVASKKDAIGYKKAKMGGFSIVMFVSMLIIAACGLYLTRATGADLGGFFTGKAPLSAGVGFYFLLVIPMLTFACSCLAFGKRK